MKQDVDLDDRSLVNKLLNILAEDDLEFSRESLVTLVAYMQAQQSFNVSTMKMIIKFMSGGYNSDDIELMFERESQVTEQMNNFIDSFLAQEDAGE